MNKHIAEKLNICQGFLPVAMNSAAQVGDWINLKNYGRVAIVLFKGVGTAGDDPTITLEQATDVAGTGAKALAITEVYKKQAATNLLAVAEYTKSTSDAPATNDTFNTGNGTWTNSDLAEQAAIIVFDVKAEDLDLHNSFDCIRAKVSDVGTNAQLGAMLYLAHDPKFGTSPLPTAIAD